MAKILLVEDNEMNRDMLSRRLTRKGYDVIVALDGASGLDMAASEDPDLILMDMSLPIMDGWEATRKIKASAETRAIPVIALTAHAMAEDRDKALDFHDRETFPNMERTLDAYYQGLAQYRGRDWASAISSFEGALAAFAGDVPSNIFLERALHHRDNPPPEDWDGVWTLTQK